MSRREAPVQPQEEYDCPYLEPGTLSIEGITFDPAHPDQARSRLEALLKDNERVWLNAYLSRRSGCYMNPTAASRMAFPELKCPLQKGHKVRERPIIQLLIQWYLAEHGLTRERLLSTMEGWIYRTDPADAEGLLNGVQTMAELRDTGFDTNMIESIKVTTRAGKAGKDGEPDEEPEITREVKFASKVTIMRDLLKALGLMDTKRAEPPVAAALHTVNVTRNTMIVQQIRRGELQPTMPGLPARRLPPGPPTAASIQDLRQLVRDSKAALEEQEAEAQIEGVIEDPTEGDYPNEQEQIESQQDILAAEQARAEAKPADSDSF